MIPGSRYKEYLNKRIKIYLPGTVLDGVLLEIRDMPEYIILKNIVGLTQTTMDISMAVVMAITEDSVL